MPRIVIDARSVVARRSGIGNCTEMLIRHLVPLAPDWEFILLRHPSETAPLTDAPNVRQLTFPGETKSTATVLRLGRVHSFSDCSLYHSPADLIPLGLQCPWVVTNHDMMWLEAPKLASSFFPVRWANGFWYGKTIAAGIRGATRVIAISQATKDGITRLFPDQADKVRVVRHGLDQNRYRPGQGKDREFISDLVPMGFRYSLIVGQGSPYKNHDGMVRGFVQATQDDPSHKLVLVRRFSRVDFKMQRLLAQPKVRDKVIVVPFVSDEVLLTLYRHAQMLLFVSHYEGFGLPAVEAMALGVPVLASTHPAVVEVTGDGAMHVDATNVSAIAQGIRDIGEGAELRAGLIEAGFRRVTAFSWGRAANQTLAVYREALNI